MEAWGKSGEELRIILERLVGETFINQWKNIYPWLRWKENAKKLDHQIAPNKIDIVSR